MLMMKQKNRVHVQKMCVFFPDELLEMSLDITIQKFYILRYLLVKFGETCYISLYLFSLH